MAMAPPDPGALPTTTASRPGARTALGQPLFREAADGSLYSHAATKLPPHWQDNP
jgi:hypothetical protein